jgi:hypothetical protein
LTFKPPREILTAQRRDALEDEMVKPTATIKKTTGDAVEVVFRGLVDRATACVLMNGFQLTVGVSRLRRRS